jgi:hypothetical protein
VIVKSDLVLEGAQYSFAAQVHQNDGWVNEYEDPACFDMLATDATIIRVHVYNRVTGGDVLAAKGVVKLLDTCIVMTFRCPHLATDGATSDSTAWRPDVSCSIILLRSFATSSSSLYRHIW